MALDCSFLYSSKAFMTVCARFCTAGGVEIVRSCTRQRLSQQFSQRIAKRMAAYCSFLHSSTAFTTVFVPYCRADGSGLLILPLVNGFHNGLLAVLLRSWQRIARSYAPQWLSQRFAPRIVKQLVADYSFLHSSTAFTKVCTPYCSADSSGLLVLMLVNGFHDCLGALLLSSWQQIARSYARQLLLRFARRIEQWMAVHCKYFHSSMAFTTVCVLHCSADGRALLILSFGIGSHGLRAVFLSGWQRIAHTSTRYRLL